MFTIRHEHHHYHHYIDPPGLKEVKDRLASLTDLAIRNQETIMAAIDTLRDDLHAYVAAVNDFATRVLAAIAAAQTASNDPAIDALDGEVKSAAADLATKAASLNTTVAPPPAPGP